MENLTARMQLFRDLVACAHKIYFSEFNMKFEPICSTAPFVNGIYLFLAIDDMASIEYMEKLAVDRQLDKNMPNQHRPVICTNSLGMMWITNFEFENQTPVKIHVMGPVFTDEYSLPNVKNRLESLNLSLSLKQQFIHFIQELPIVPLIRMYEYGLMLHRCLTDEVLTISELMYSSQNNTPLIEWPNPENNAHGIYAAEIALLKMVKEGNLQYQKESERLSSFGSVGKLIGGNPLRQAKNAVIIFTALCARAAIAGGLSPDTAYMLSDQYIYNVEGSTNLDAISELSHTMMEDYIRRVHRLKNSNKISPQIQSVCDRLSIHPEEKLDIHMLAKQFGYSDYYLTKKFKSETGITIKEFLLDKRIERSKLLLLDSGLTIAEIADSLHFNSQSYFGRLFRNAVGVSATEYRNKHGLLEIIK